MQPVEFLSSSERAASDQFLLEVLLFSGRMEVPEFISILANGVSQCNVSSVSFVGAASNWFLLEAISVLNVQFSGRRNAGRHASRRDILQ